jgi:hypothetical protein
MNLSSIMRVSLNTTEVEIVDLEQKTVVKV